MANHVNRADVIVTLRDVHEQPITDEVEITFYNQKVHSLSKRFTVKFRGSEEKLPGIAAFPTGISEVFIKPTKFRHKSIFMNVIGGKENILDQDFFMNPDKARPRLIDFDDLPAKAYGDELQRILLASRINRAAWNGLNSRIRATVLNLCAKMLKETTNKTGQTLISQIENIDRTWLDTKHQERIYAVVNPGLLNALRKYPEKYKGVSGGLHKFPQGWVPVGQQDSFKTRDKAGNIQLTFATGAQGTQLADIDLDDHSGVQHAADVMKHKISGKNTDPYNLHQILVYFQGIDPGYRLT